ncbi:PHP domain-containing protein [Halopelagius inordinatus]|uniref:PHP domain-containing protein n=1 Tax=Halopelagius inordinatus TaxID=553467 RepID=UPI000A62A314|nr:PHP domain-containing protein [Halopelagius inordinatus]
MIRDRNGEFDGETPVADLHLHTTASDGTLTVPELPAAARDGGVAAIAVTDHDRVHPDLDAPVTTLDGVTVVRGIELRVDAGDQRVDLLGYGVEDVPAIRDLTERIQRDRKERGRRIVDRVESRLDVSLDVELGEGIGRPNVARAVAESDAPFDYQGAFDHLIGSDGPCYVARWVPDFEAGVAALRDSCAVVGLAHPFRYPDPESALELTSELDAVERFYPYGGASAEREDGELLDEYVERNELLATGGTDAHEKTLGVAGPPRAEFEAFAACVPGV